MDVIFIKNEFCYKTSIKETSKFGGGGILVSWVYFPERDYCING